MSKVKSPEDIKKLSIKDSMNLCSDIRDKIIHQLSITPGHFSSSLGVVELTVAIHQIFDTPNDKLIWDVGHQTYAHKIITGRFDKFKTLRTHKGLSGFPKIIESVYDNFGTGHSSTSISAIMGMAVASKLDNKQNQHIAVIGDGALTAGMAFEALNNLVEIDANILIIINDNQMSIDKNIGGLEQHFSKILDKKETNFFTNLGIDYYGIVDGNNYKEIYKELLYQKTLTGVRILHCKTEKGKGYTFAEKGKPEIWHSPGKFNIKTGERKLDTSNYPKKYQDVFGEELVKLAKNNNNIVAITPAMTSGSSLNMFKDKFPSRFFDVGIAEQHAVTFSAGLAVNKKVPFCVIYSTFLQRAYDQIIHDVAIQKLHVIFCIDRAGLVGEDGITHHGIFDVSFLRIIPNLIIISPRNEQELINAMHWSVKHTNNPIAIRYPRGKGVLKKLKKPKDISLATSELLIKGEKTAIISLGRMAEPTTNAIKLLNNINIYPSHYDLRFIKPIDKKTIKNISIHYTNLIIVEENSMAGGVGSYILEYLSSINSSISVKIIGIEDSFIEHGDIKELHREIGLDYYSIYTTIKQFI